MPDQKAFSQPISTGGKATTSEQISEVSAVGDGSHVAILMGTYNGERFLGEQLASIERQEHLSWTLYASDDGSKDGTLGVLEATRQAWGADRLTLLQGPKQGFAKNFLSLVCRPEIEANFFAWCDQDDIWYEDKLEVALAWLKTIPHSTPAIYCGRTETIGESGLSEGCSPLFKLQPRFANALVQSIAGGNTMVFNRAARALLQEAGADLTIPSHDWWAYQLITGAGGVVRYDATPKVRYRQHDANIVGSNSSWSARSLRMRLLFKGRLVEWTEQTIAALDSMQHRLSRDHQVTYERFKSARKQFLPLRLIGCFRAGIYRQTVLGTLGLLMAFTLKKI